MVNGDVRVSPDPRLERRRAFWLLALMMLLTGSAASLAVPAEPAVAAPVAVTCAIDANACEAMGLAQSAASPEQQLADLFAPVVMLKRQSRPCDPEGEAYVPAPVEVVLNDPNVVLRHHTGRRSEEIVKTAPTAYDIANLGPDYDLDFPGNPRNAGCTYEIWGRTRMAAAGLVPTTYANVVVSPTLHKVAIQYWFWYIFNDFNNTHEGDWEMVQLIFDAGSVEEAMTLVPVETGYSQHSGGERARWTDPKVQKEGNRPVVYPASGSHASQYTSGVFLGWGENGSGFGCDVTTGPSDRVDPVVVLLPGTVKDPASPMAWTSFAGLWGERQRAFYSGITGPTGRARWEDPFTWQDQIRDSNLKVSGGSAPLGPGAASTFCTLSHWGSLALTRVVVYPWIVVGLLAAMIYTFVFLIRVGGSVVSAAWGVYWRYWRVFVALGALLVPVGLLAYLLLRFTIGHSPGRQIFQTMDATPGAWLAAAIAIGAVQQIVSLLVIGPAAIEAVDALYDNQRPSLAGAFQRVGERIWRLATALIVPVVVIALLSISVIGIPWALRQTVRWWFTAQAVLMDNASAAEARKVSERLVAGRWWRVAGTVALLSLVAIAAGPLIGIIVLVVATPSIGYINLLSSGIYAMLLPVAVIGSCVLYRRLQGEPIQPPLETAPATQGATPTTATP